MYGPEPRTMNGGVPLTDRYARTGLLTPPGMTASARRRRSSLFFRSGVTGSAQARGDLAREIGQDEVRAGALDAEERLVHDALLVENSRAGGRLDHRVLAGDLVRRDRNLEP